MGEIKTMTNTKKSFAKRIIAIIIALSTLITLYSFNTVNTYATTVNTKYPTKSIKGYIISTNNKTAIAYSNIGCTSKIGYIYSTDDCTLQQIYTNGIVKVKAPWTGYSNGRVIYTKLSYFFQNTSTVSTKTATVKTKCYSRSNLKTSLGYVYVGDKCYIVGTSGDYYQTLCPWTGGIYRICWVNKSAFGHTHSYTITGYEAAHPHRQYRKCNCGASYYTGATQKVSSCKTCYPSKSYTAWVNTSSAPLVLRKSASTSAPALANMPKGSQITVLDNKTKTNGFYHVKYNGKTGYASANYITFFKPIVSDFSLMWPTSANYVTCMYYYKNGSKHQSRYGYTNAMDIAGGGNIYAAESGTVESATYQSGGFGNYIVIKHKNGTRSLYAHLLRYTVRAGQSVSKGQTIGVMGSTGNSSGTHLHFEWSGGDPWKTFFKNRTSTIYESNVRSNNVRYNADKTIVNYIDANYRYIGGWYYHK